jgi:hypothetical protein
MIGPVAVRVLVGGEAIESPNPSDLKSSFKRYWIMFYNFEKEVTIQKYDFSVRFWDRIPVIFNDWFRENYLAGSSKEFYFLSQSLNTIFQVAILAKGSAFVR